MKLAAAKHDQLKRAHCGTVDLCGSVVADQLDVAIAGHGDARERKIGRRRDREGDGQRLTEARRGPVGEGCRDVHFGGPVRRHDGRGDRDDRLYASAAAGDRHTLGPRTRPRGGQREHEHGGK